MYREEGLPQYLPEIAVQPVTFINYNRTVSMGCYKKHVQHEAHTHIELNSEVTGAQPSQ